MTTDTPPLRLIVSFFKNAALVQSLFGSLETILPELREMGCQVVVINHSPDDRELGAALLKAVAHLSEAVPCRIVQNAPEMQALHSVSAWSLGPSDTKNDVLWLHADTIVFPGVVSELRRIAYLDPMIGFVSPRSNDGDVCSLPHQREFRSALPAESHANFCTLSQYLPECHFVPIAETFCVYIKLEVIELCGFIGENDPGSNEEHAFLARASKAGYRTVLANHAFVYHNGQCPAPIYDFQNTHDEKERETRDKNYTGYSRDVTEYLECVTYEAERMLAALLPDNNQRLDVLFDFSGLKPSFGGSFEAGNCIWKSAMETWQEWFNIFILVSGEASQFQELDAFKCAQFVPPDTRRRFAIAFRVGQLVEPEQLFRMSRRAVLNLYGMFDAIPFDSLGEKSADLSLLSSGVFQHSDGVLYLSEVTRDHCRRRFGIGGSVRELVVPYEALNLRDADAGKNYTCDDLESSSDEAGYILIMDLALDNEFVRATGEVLSKAFPTERVVVFREGSDEHDQLIYARCGHQARLQNLIHRAKLVIYPPGSDDIGIAVVKCLALSKPVFAPLVPVVSWIQANVQNKNLFLYSSLRDLIERLPGAFPVRTDRASVMKGNEPTNSEAATLQISQFLRELLHTWSISTHLLSRLEYIRLMKDKAMVASYRATAVDAEARASRSASELLEVVGDRDARIADIHGSLSWRVTAPLRTLGDVIQRWFDRGRVPSAKAVAPSSENDTVQLSIEEFDESAYLALNPDIEAAVVKGDVQTGYQHWVQYGAAESRKITAANFPPDWNEGWYLRVNPDVAASVRVGAFTTGYQHWLNAGQYEARPAGGRMLYPRTSLTEALKKAQPGFNGVGFYDAGIGLGAAARNHTAALVQVLPFTEIPVPWDFDRIQEFAPEPPKYAVNVIHLNPDVLPLFLHYQGGAVLPGRYNIAFWIWELHAGYPSWQHLSTIFNEIWTASAYSATAIRTVSRAPVWVIPYVVDKLPDPAPNDRSQFGWNDDVFVFLYVFDLASSFDRKNPLALIRSFQKAFANRKDVLLVLKYQNPHLDPPAAALLERLSVTVSNVQLISESFPEERVYALLRGCDCFVSPHRSEGFGLNIAHAMYYGKPVVATGYSGNLEFTTDENSYLIDYELAAVQRDNGYYKRNYAWAEVSEDHLASLLERVMKTPEESQRKGENARHTIRERFSLEAVTEAIRQRVNQWGM